MCYISVNSGYGLDLAVAFLLAIRTEEAGKQIRQIRGSGRAVWLKFWLINAQKPLCCL